jgi:hypothetical protein
MNFQGPLGRWVSKLPWRGWDAINSLFIKRSPISGNTNSGGRLSTVDLLITVSFFLRKANNIDDLN